MHYVCTLPIVVDGSGCVVIWSSGLVGEGTGVESTRLLLPSTPTEAFGQPGAVVGMSTEREKIGIKFKALSSH